MKLSVKIGKNSFYIYSILVGIGSILFSGNVFTGYIFTAVQILFILVCFISRMRSKSVCFLFISIILGLSYDMGLGSMGFEWYTIKTIKLLGVNLGIWIMVPFFAVAIANKSVTREKCTIKICKDYFLDQSCRVVNRYFERFCVQ